MESSSPVSPPLIANPVSSSSTRARESQSRRRKKKMKTQQSQSLSSQNPNPNNNSNISQPSKISWKSETTRQLYSSKFLQTLRHMRLNSSSSSPAAPSRRGRAVKEAADRVLAMAARGRTRWSRAILTGRLRIKFMNKKLKRQRARATGDSRSPKKPRVEILKLKGKNLPAVQRKVKTLARLVPGCRKETTPAILEEATDYIPALEMQARVLREILALFNSVGAGGGSAGHGGSAGQGSSSGPLPPENGSA